MDSGSAREYILKRLKEDLPASRTYHSLEHTLDVYAVSISIAENEGVDGVPLVLLKTAALYHDCGFLHQAFGHEEKGCEIVREHLPRFGYDQAAIEQIVGLIMATKVPQSPHNELEKILCDADLDYLGRNDFELIGDRLYAELFADGLVEDQTAWDELQVRFISQHRYFTKTNRGDREKRKQQNLLKVQARVAARK